MIKKSYRLLLLFTLLFQGTLPAQAPKDSYSSSSVLATGKWFRIAVLKDGIYRISFSKLKELGLADPSHPRIFGNNSGQLSYYAGDPSPDDLKEISIYENKGSDNSFSDGDYLLFYAQGTGRWKFNYQDGDYDYVQHNYSDTAFYFITSGTSDANLVIDAVPPSAAPGFTTSSSDALFIHEEETENLLKSGREWYQPVSSSTALDINPGFSGILTDQKMKIRLRVVARSPILASFRLSEGTQVIKNVTVSYVNMLDYTGTYAQTADSSWSSYPASSTPSFSVSFNNNGEAGARGWVDFMQVQCRKDNVFTGATTGFCDSKVAGSGHITQFTVRSPGLTPVIWDITNPQRPENINYSKSGDNIIFKSQTDSLRYFIAFSSQNADDPIFFPQPVTNQDLHGSGPADMIIVTHPLFAAYASKLAKLHHAENGLSSMIVTPGQIYNEFSGGIPDIAAIRNFLRMKYLRQKGSAHPLKYLLLLGDGSYENRTPPPKNPDFIPTYQSQNSTVVVSSFTSDDFYGLLDDGEGEADGTLDIGIGRLPVNDTTQAGAIFRKIERYAGNSGNGDWKNIICFTADDEDGNAHMNDAEGLAKVLSDSVPVFNIDKIYLDAYRQVTTSNGQTYPDVETAINNRINSGCLIFNYIGHGNETGLAHERVVKTEDINSWKNGSKLPLFITATCEFSRFDDGDLNVITREIKQKTSAGEMVLLNENGGGIALMSTTRVVYSAPNYFLNRSIYNYAFTLDSAGNPHTLGDIIMLAKNSSGGGSNKRNFSLLGDPAVRFEFPWHGNVVTDSVNHLPVSAGIDTLKALSIITVSGHVTDFRGRLMNSFNGDVLPLVYDKATMVSTLANDGGPAMKFALRNNILFSGKTKAEGGKFRFRFMVPRDIDYNFGNGKISYYATDDKKDMNGYDAGVVVGGFASIFSADTSGPRIRLFMNDTLFRDGGITDADPALLAIISDSSGINTTGSGIGHDLTAWLDSDKNNVVLLNSYFENDFDDFSKGRVYYNLYDLASGGHSITLKAWDNYNNSSEQTIHFLVEKDGRFILKNLINYPNPLINETHFTGEINRTGQEIKIIISIFDLSGRTIRRLESNTEITGYEIPPVPWDGCTEGGQRAGRGIYPYRITVKTGGGEMAEATGRLIIL